MSSKFINGVMDKFPNIKIVVPHGGAFVPIIGATKVQQVDDAAKVSSIELTSDEVSTLDKKAIAIKVLVKGEIF